jgi:hypothetical protein
MRNQCTLLCVIITSITAILVYIMFQRMMNFEQFQVEQQQRAIPTLAERSQAVIDALLDTASSRLVNTQDMNTAYDIWASNMAKRGLAGTIYTSPQLFDTLQQMVIDRDVVRSNVMKVIAPYYDKELRLIYQNALQERQNKLVKRGVCSN